MSEDRYWQNWDNADVSKRIDEYWTKSEGAWRELICKKIMNFVGTEGEILEVGCGSGLICHGLVTKGFPKSRYSGGDISEKMLELAQERFPDISFRKIDIFNLDIPDESVDNVICIHVVQHLPHYEDAVRELLRITKKKLYLVSWFQEEEDITFTKAAKKWANQRFYNNKYSLSKFEQFVNSIADVKISKEKILNYCWAFKIECGYEDTDLHGKQ